MNQYELLSLLMKLDIALRLATEDLADEFDGGEEFYGTAYHRYIGYADNILNGRDKYHAEHEAGMP